MTDFVVTTLDDELLEDDSLSLREAVALANASAGADRISFAPELAGQIRLIQGAIDITDDLTIEGAGKITITGDADGDDLLDVDGLSDGPANALSLNKRVLDDNTNILTLSNANAKVQGITLTGGGIVGTGDLAIRDSALIGTHAGAVDIVGDLALLHSIVRNNAAQFNADDRFNERGHSVIATEGSSTIVSSTITGNPVLREGEDGHTVFATDTVTLVQATVIGNNGLYNEYSNGGGSISARSAINLYNSAIAGNINRFTSPQGLYYSREYEEVGVTRPVRDINGDLAELTISNSIVFGRVDSNAPFELTGANIIDGRLVSPNANNSPVSATEVFAKTNEQVFRGSDLGYANGRDRFDGIEFLPRLVAFNVPVVAPSGGPVPTAVLSPFTSNRALDAGIGTLPSEADLGVDVDGDGTISTDQIDTDANGNPRVVGGAIDLGPVELQRAPEPGRLRVVGDDGTNTLTDGPGKDNMFGGRGADVFVLTADGFGDHIKDFEVGVDRVDISAWGVSDYLELEITEHRTGKRFIAGGPEFLGLRSLEGPLTIGDISAETFIFAAAPPSAGPVRLVQGTDGRDKLFGSALDDRVVDGGGVDNLFGRGGADTFVLIADGVADSVKDFETGVDVINISAWGVTEFAQLSFEQRNEGKVIVRFQDEVLAVQDQGNSFSIDQLNAESFVLFDGT